MAELRIVFMGTAELSCMSLGALANNADFKVVAAVTQPDRPKGRDLKLLPPPVKELASRLGLSVLQPPRARDPGFIDQMRSLKADLIAVAAYGQILPQTLLDLPRFGCLNVHTSLLPKYRGAAPIQWAVLNGDTETGVTIMKMDAGLDTGEIVAQETTPIQEDDTAETLYRRLGEMGAKLLVRSIPEYVAGRIQPRPQPSEGVSLAPKIRKEDGRIDWKRPAPVILNQLRGLVPWPGAFTFLPGKPMPRLLKIWEARAVENRGDASAPPGTVLQADKTGILVACSEGGLQILALQQEGSRRLSAGQFIAGHSITPGLQLG